VTKAQRQAQFDCQMSHCRYYNRCTVYWGGRCAKLGGKRIPRFRYNPSRNIDLIGLADVVTLR